MKFRTTTTSTICGVLLSTSLVNAITLDLNSQASIKSAAKTCAQGMMNYYSGNKPGGIPGLLPDPYYWWEAGAMFGSLIDYWYYTGDETYNQDITQALLHQASPKSDFMPQNQTRTLGNDDQAFWGMAAMSAAEVKFPNPPSDKPQWLALAQAVFNLQATRWDNSSCGGGLKWQIFWFNNGYNYKNSISQGGFFNIAARLGAYTQNTTYFEHAEKMWDWTSRVGLISNTSQVFDGSDDNLNCSELNHIEWSYNNGIFLYGAAVMWNQTTGDTQAKWRTRVAGLIKGSSLFFTGPNKQIMYEQACETQGNCNVDQRSFKAYLARWMAATTKVAPWTSDQLMPLLQQSAKAAAQSCVGGTDGSTCGTKWDITGWDGAFGVGQQMNALEVIQSNLITTVQGPLSNKTGAISVGNPNAGTTGDSLPWMITTPITTADRAGAGILTTLAVVGTLAGVWWIVT